MLVQFGFYAWSAIAFAMVVALLKYAGNPKIVIGYFISGLIWLIYLVAISQTGILNSLSLPPKVPLLIIIPSIIAIVVITGRLSFKGVLEKTPLHIPVFLNSFRIIVELLIYGAYRNGVFPQRVTFEGLNFDVLVGLSALVVGTLLIKRKLSFRSLLIWNIASLLVLTLTGYSFISTFYFTDYIAVTGQNYFVRFPYLLLPSVMLPIAIFLHVFSIRQVLLFTRVNGWQTA